MPAKIETKMNGKSMKSAFEMTSKGEERRDVEEDDKINFPAAPLATRSTTHQRQ
jgi:hypothetical protein